MTAHPYWTNGLSTLYEADARDMPLRDGSVHCVVTSPPYWMQRVYRGNDARGIGLEDTVDGWIDNLLHVFREVGRVLRDDGLLWVNLGDKRDSAAGWGRGGGSTLEGGAPAKGPEQRKLSTLNKLALPERFALAMQADGWIWRDTVIWYKRSPMPECLSGTRWERCRVKISSNSNSDHGKNGGSIDRRAVGFNDRWDGVDSASAQWSDCPGCPKCEANDGYVLRRGSWRCTSAFEYIFMFAKTQNYWSDGEGVKMRAIHEGRIVKATGAGAKNAGNINNTARGFTEHDTVVHGANRRNVWSDIKPEPFGGPHYATFPPDLPRLCIQASTSEKGVCPSCGAQWARVIDRKGGLTGKSWHPHKNDEIVGQSQVRHSGGVGNATDANGEHYAVETLGWRPTCTCGPHDTIPATVLDPFAGTGTTLLAAQRLGLRSYGTDISQEYLSMAIERLRAQSMPMLGLI